MSLSELPDVALIKIFRTLDHIELVRLYHSFDSSKRIQNLIENCSYLWINIHIKSTVDYNLFIYFSRLLILNASTTRQLIIDQLDLTCRKILIDNEFSLKKFSNLEKLIIHDTFICNSLQTLNFCSQTLEILYLTNEYINLNNLNQLKQLKQLQITLYSNNIFQNINFQQLTNLNLKLMFDYDHQSNEIFKYLPKTSLEIFKLNFLFINNDLNFLNEFTNYLNSCIHLHTLELFYLHGMCPIILHRNIDYYKYERIILVNICQLKQMKIFIESNQYDLPLDFLILNTAVNLNQYSSCIHNQTWVRRQVISIDYLQCVTTSIELLNEMNVIWSDKNQMTQSFESYFLRSIYNIPHLTTSIRNLFISKFELSLNGLITLMTSLPLVYDFIITDGRIDQMGSGMSDIEKIIQTTINTSQSNIQKIQMNNISLSRRTIVNLCLITQYLISLTMNDVKIIDKTNTQPTVLVLLKQIAQYTDQFKWNQLKSLTFGKNLLNRQNLYSFIPSQINNIYGINLNHLSITIHDNTIFETHDLFLKSIKKFLKNFPKLTSFIIEFTKRYEGQFRLRNQLQILFETNFNKKISVYPTPNDLACRFCFDTNFDNNESDNEESSSQQYRTFCGIPLFQLRKQRKSNVFS